MAFYFIDCLIPKARRLLEKLEFPSIDLENRYSGVGSRYDQKISEPDPAHEQRGEQNDPESTPGEVKDEPQVDPAGNELRSRSVVRGISDNLIIALIAFINAQRTPLSQPRAVPAYLRTNSRRSLLISLSIITLQESTAQETFNTIINEAIVLN
jgi:hypothetical protein